MILREGIGEIGVCTQTYSHTKVLYIKQRGVLDVKKRGIVGVAIVTTAIALLSRVEMDKAEEGLIEKRENIGSLMEEIYNPLSEEYDLVSIENKMKKANMSEEVIEELKNSIRSGSRDEERAEITVSWGPSELSSDHCDKWVVEVSREGRKSMVIFSSKEGKIYKVTTLFK